MSGSREQRSSAQEATRTRSDASVRADAPPPPGPVFFPTPPDLRNWFEAHHDSADELWVGYYKKATGIPSIDWPESVDEALCFGWIDGIRRSVDDESYKIRFTPRRKRSHWSARNLGRMKHLIEAGRVTEAGMAAYRARDPGHSERAAYEQGEVNLPAEYERRLRAVPEAWSYWEEERPWYRKQVTWWVVSAKREETRRRRLKILIESCATGDVIPAMPRMARRKR